MYPHGCRHVLRCFWLYFHELDPDLQDVSHREPGPLAVQNQALTATKSWRHELRCFAALRASTGAISQVVNKVLEADRARLAFEITIWSSIISDDSACALPNASISKKRVKRSHRCKLNRL